MSSRRQLTYEMKMSLVDQIRNNPYQSTKDLQRFFFERYHWEICQTTLSCILKKEGLGIKKQGGKGRNSSGSAHSAPLQHYATHHSPSPPSVDSSYHPQQLPPIDTFFSQTPSSSPPREYKIYNTDILCPSDPQYDTSYNPSTPPRHPSSNPPQSRPPRSSTSPPTPPALHHMSSYCASAALPPPSAGPLFSPAYQQPPPSHTLVATSNSYMNATRSAAPQAPCCCSNQRLPLTAPHMHGGPAAPSPPPLAVPPHASTPHHDHPSTLRSDFYDINIINPDVKRFRPSSQYQQLEKIVLRLACELHRQYAAQASHRHLPSPPTSPPHNHLASPSPPSKHLQLTPAAKSEMVKRIKKEILSAPQYRAVQKPLYLNQFIHKCLKRYQFSNELISRLQ